MGKSHRHRAVNKIRNKKKPTAIRLLFLQKHDLSKKESAKYKIAIDDPEFLN